MTDTLTYKAYILTRDFMHAILAVWGGAKLADVLALVGIPNCSRVTPSGQKHVEFVSIDKCKVIPFRSM